MVQISPKVSQTLDGFDRFTINGHTAIRRKARVAHKCDVCPQPILKGESYFELTPNGSGVGGFKKPWRVHPKCIFGLKEVKEDGWKKNQ